jgi:hypothetical protein
MRINSHHMKNGPLLQEGGINEAKLTFSPNKIELP